MITIEQTALPAPLRFFRAMLLGSVLGLCIAAPAVGLSSIWGMG